MGIEDGTVTTQRVWVDASGPDGVALAAYAEIHRAAFQIERARDINREDGVKTGPAQPGPETERAVGS